MAQTKTKIDIFSGFLGAGKTTLIKKLIQEAFGGEKLVLRGRGKAIFVGAGGTSRKGKIYAEFDRYL